MMMNSTRPTAPHPYFQPWSWAHANEALPRGLPLGALTVIRIRGTDHRVREWHNTVADLVNTTIAQHRPVSYVPVDSDDLQPPRHLTPTLVAEGGKVGILPDQDHMVHARDDRGQPRSYGCGVPTLDRVQELVSGFEDDYGPSLVVLDGIEKARPYPALSQNLVMFPGGLTITRRGMNEWRALEMSGYADMRPDTPTVVVWHDNGSQAHADAIDLLYDVAIVIVEAFSSPEGDVLTISQRDDFDEQFPYQQAVHIA